MIGNGNLMSHPTEKLFWKKVCWTMKSDIYNIYTYWSHICCCLMLYICTSSATGWCCISSSKRHHGHHHCSLTYGIKSVRDAVHGGGKVCLGKKGVLQVPNHRFFMVQMKGSKIQVGITDSRVPPCCGCTLEVLQCPKAFLDLMKMCSLDAKDASSCPWCLLQFATHFPLVFSLYKQEKCLKWLPRWVHHDEF